MKTKCNLCKICKSCKFLKNLEIITAYEPFEPLPLGGTDGFSVSIDIGTTTLAFELIDRHNHEVIATHSCLNSQYSYGADIITRITYANEGNLHHLHNLIHQDIKEGIKILSPPSPPSLVITGNTTMLHFLQNFPCDTLGVYPFTPFSVHAQNTEILGYPAFIFPCISAFVGADVVSGLFCLDYPRISGHNLLIDLGTNAEIALFSPEKLIVTSAAAGNAFEGGNKNGADAIKSFDTLSPKDANEIILAKAAVRSGIKILLEEAGILYDNIERVFLAGGFGYKIDVKSAVRIGLFPAPLADKIKPIGNIALGGCTKYALSPHFAEHFVGLQEINLATHKNFNDYFLKYIHK
ncbi:MAG: ASKHA domain-containing protein [Defluviitaleaceae bacterium]|nr:ASKHA domain-containing protein [Defluviitaleaceae bacterium]